MQKSDKASNHSIPNKAFIVVESNTAFNDGKGDSLRETWILKRLKYHEPQYWKFGEEGNKYFRHATEVEHVDERSMCCGTPPDCEWKAKGGKMCVASFDWSCSGVCKSVERMKDVHHSCGEGDAICMECC
ncbi:hypothetical protein HAX54_046246 [Datura stramonium]|uniref:Hexosyltransferase n=1 Tax=Datura stramonium TaxID=4076 RepID=A0ABS8WGP5_DATST|nr:hypothetical protein [Datura stramonium]